MWSLNRARKEWANWRRAIGQSSTYLGLALIGFIWISLSFHLQVERSAAERAAIQNSRNLVRVFEEHLSRSIHDIDRALKVLRSHYVRNPASIDLEDWKRQAQIVSDPATRVSIVGPDGFVRLSSSNGGNSVDYSGREHFRVHVNAATDELFISPPVVGLMSGKLAIFLTRRIENADGSFGGIIVASLDPSYFARFYSSVDTGLDGYARIIGTDGIVRAEGGVTTNFIGRNMSGGALFKRYMEDPTGWFYTDSALSDHIHRLIVYRRLKDFPLIVNLGLATKQIFLEVAAKQHAYYVFATIFSALILIIMGFSMRGRLLLERKSAELRTQNLRFDAALQNMSQGLSMFDRDGRLIVCNDRYAQVYGLPATVKPGTTLRQILEGRVASGTFAGPTPEGYVAERLAVASERRPIDTIGELNNGRIIAVAHRPIADGSWVATHEDITSRRRSERELERTRKFLDTVIENVPATIIVKEPGEGRYVLVNRAAERFLGLSRDQLIGKTVRDILSPEDAARILAHDEQALQSRDGCLGDDHSITTPGNGRRSVVTRKLVIRDEEGEPQYLLAVIEDVTERKQAEDQIAHMALHDALTDLPNRVLFHRRLEQALLRVRRGENLAVLCLDLDHFKNVNDTHGHPLGDELLKAVAERLRGCVRETDTLARLGGDEFAIIQAGIAQPADTLALLNRIQHAIKAPYDLDAVRAAMDVSIGISLAPTDSSEPDQLLQQADMALYGAKADGRGTYRFFEPEMDARLKARRKLEADLRTAIGSGGLDLHYQPLVNLERNEIVGLEALLRWPHPDRGMIPPSEFIPLAEDTGLIVPLGEWVLRQACFEATNWPDNIKIAVNLSPAQFRSPNLVQVVVSALAASRVPPARLELEVTEALLLQDNEENLASLHHLRDLGVQIVMDDFGTGYSSLNYLQRFPFDKIKIDRSFVANLSSGNDVALAIVQAVVSLAGVLKITAVAEGVETEQQLALVKAAGCAEAQGYIFSPPKPAKEIAQLFPPRPEQAVSAA
jgi:diguanylate cyclase (GGDEF)-like protein/PAS domain S-box-containing protein